MHKTQRLSSLIPHPSSLIFACLLVGAMALFSLAQVSRTVSIPNLSGIPGATVFVPINISNASGIAGVEATVSFNPAHLQVVRPGNPARTTTLTSGFSISGNADNTAGTVRVALSSSTAIVSGNGALAEIEFQARPDAPIGASANLTLSNVTLRDANGNALSAPTLTNGRFTVATPSRQVRIPNVSVPAGDKVQVSVTVNDASGIAGGDFNFTFNPAILQATRPESPAQLTSLTSGFNATGRADNAAGTVQVALASNNAIASGSGTLFTVEFQVNRNATSGMTSALNFTQVILRDALTNRIAASTANGTFTVAAGRRITIPATSGLAGTEVNVPINIDNAAGVAGGEFTLTYNPAIAQVLRPGNPAQTTALTSGFNVSGSADNTAGQVRVSFSGATPIVSGSGALVTIAFRLNPNATPGQSTTLTFVTAIVRDAGGEAFASTPTNGTLSVSTPSRRLSIPNVSGAAGGRVTVSVTANDASGIAGGNLSFTYNPAFLQSVTPTDPARPTALTTGFTFSGKADNETGRIDISFASATGIASGSGALFTVEFQAPLTAPTGSSAPLNFVSTTLFDALGNRIPTTLQNGTFTVQAGRRVSVPNASGTPGSVININVVIDEGNGLAGADITLRYNPSVIQVVRPGNPAQTTALTANFSVSGRADNTAGQVQFSLSSATPLPAGGGTLATIAFQVNPNANAGATSAMTLAGAVLRDRDSILIPSSVTNGTFTVSSVTPRRVSIPNNLTAPPGGIVQVPLNVDNHNGVAGGDFSFTFDPTLLQVVRPEAPAVTTGLTTGFSVSGRADNGRGEVRLSLAGAAALGAGGGTILRVDFQVRPDAMLGRSSGLNFTAATLRDRDGNLIPTTTTNGILTVSGALQVTVPTVDASVTLPTPVPINMTDATGVAGGDITLTFDPTIVQVVNPAAPAEPGSLAPDLSIAGNADNFRGVVNLTFSRSRGIPGGGGTLLRVIMQVNPTAPLDRTSPLNLTNVVLRDELGGVIPTTVTNGLLRIVADRLISTPSLELAPGSDVFVPVRVNNAANVAGLDVDFRFDNNFLQIDTNSPVQLTPLTSGFTFSVNADNNAGRVLVSLASADAIAAGSGAMVLLNMRLKDTAPVGQSTPLTIAAASLHGRFGTRIPTILSSGSLQSVEFRVRECEALDKGGGAGDELRLRFSATLNATEAVNPANYDVRVPDTSPTPLDLTNADITYDNLTATVTISRLSLTMGDSYKVTVTGVHTSGGAPLPEDGVRNVCTGAVRDGVPPKVVSCGATDNSITVTFDEAMNLVDATQSFFHDLRIPATASTPIDLTAAVVTYNDTTRTATISNVAVPNNTTFKVRVVVVRDLAGNSIVDDGVSNVCSGITPATSANIVTTTADNGDNVNPVPNSLRAAILFANSRPGPDVIQFQIPTSDPNFDGQVFTIRPQGAMLPLTDSDTTIDGSTQTAFTGDTNPNGPEVVINGALAGTDGLTITSANNVVHGLVINGFIAAGSTFNDFSGAGIMFNGVGAMGNRITGCYLGTDASGTAAVSNGVGVLLIGGASSNVIGGTSANERNVISGNGSGGGVQIQASNGNRVEGNIIGTNATGDAAVGNAANGVIILNGAQSNVIGGTTPGAGNVISGNGQNGVEILGDHPSVTTSNNTVQGNRIGTDAGGTTALPNAQSGVLVANAVDQAGAVNNLIGGADSSAGNLISGNDKAGVLIAGATTTGNTVSGNRIGTNTSGDTALPNLMGVRIAVGANDNTIGGAAVGERNLISGNSGAGVMLDGTGTSNNRIVGNFIGTNDGGGAPLPNGSHGVLISDGASGNIVGGTGATEGNLIAFNGLNGVQVSGANSVNNRLIRNRIFANVGIAINLVGGTEDADGVTDNDPGDADSGPNNLMNFPVITSAVVGSLTVSGTLDTLNPQNATVDIFATSRSSTSDPLRHDGETWLGSATPQSDGTWSVTLDLILPDTSYITATATDADGNTSEFSAPVVPSAAPPTAEPRLFVGASPSVVNVGDSSTLSVRVATTDNTAVAGATVNLQVTQGGGNLSATSMTTDNNGSAAATLSNVPLGVNTVRFTTTVLGHDLSATVDVTAAQRIQIEAGLSFIALAPDVSSIAPPDLFQIPANELRLARWEPSLNNGAGDYVFYAPTNVDATHQPFNLRRFVGYWLRADNPFTLNVNAPLPDTSAGAEINLSRNPANGWVAVGNSTPFPLRWDISGIHVLQGSNDLGALSQVGGIGGIGPSTPLLDPYAWIWNTQQNAYRLVFDPRFLADVALPPEFTGTSVTMLDELPAMRGAYMFVRGENLRLRVPNSLLVRQSPRPDSSGQPKPARLSRKRVQPTVDNWTVELRAATVTERSIGNLFGVTNKLPNGVQVKKAPLAQANRPFVDVAFVPTESSRAESPSPLAWDLRKASPASKIWEFTVTTNQSQKDVTLTWDGLGKLPKPLRPYLVDAETGKRQFMRTTTGFTFRTGDAPMTTRRFRIEVTNDRNGKLQLTVLPSRDGDGAGTRLVRFAYVLNRPAAVQARVISPTGKLFAALPPRPSAQGLNVLTWDGKAQTGAFAPRGVYIFEVVAQDEEGEQVRAVRAVAVR